MNRYPLRIVSTILATSWMVIILFVGGIANAGPNHSLKGPSFGDPSQIQSMPKHWIDRPIKYDGTVKSADLVVSLNQQFYDFMKPMIQRYGNKNGLNIHVIKGTCGISSRLLVNKKVDIAGFCCPPAETDRLPNLQFHIIAIHPLELLVNAKNPIDNVTVYQARKIFQGIFVRWSELGWKNILILPIMRLHCKKRYGHWRLLLDNEDLFSPVLREVGSIPDMYDIITSTPGAIGFEVGWSGKQYEGTVKTLKINGYQHDKMEHILSGNYPFYRTIYLTTWTGNQLAKPHAVQLVEQLKEEMRAIENKIGIIPAYKLRKAGWKFKGDELIGEPGNDNHS